VSSVEEALEEARDALFVAWETDHYIHPAELDTLIAAARAEGPQLNRAHINDLIRAARSGHDGLREAETQIAQLRSDLGQIQRLAENPYFYDGTIAKLAARALSPEAEA